MSDHIDAKKLIRRYITDEADIRAVAERCALKDVDRRILVMILAEKHDRGFVADTLGYSISQVGRRFSEALPVFVSVARKLHFIP